MKLMKERSGSPFTRADQATLAPGYYWIHRETVDGAEWEIARFVRWNDEGRWEIPGTEYPGMPTSNPDASNAWRIGPRVEMPESLRPAPGTQFRGKEYSYEP